MSEEIIKILDALAEKFGLAINWTSSNVTPYIEWLCGKCVNYEIATSIIWLLFGIGWLILGGILFKKMKYCYGEIDDVTNEEDFYVCGCAFAAVGCGISIIVGLIVMMYQLFDIVTCFTFPEKIIIDQLKSIYSGMNR